VKTNILRIQLPTKSYFFWWCFKSFCQCFLSGFFRILKSIAFHRLGTGRQKSSKTFGGNAKSVCQSWSIAMS